LPCAENPESHFGTNTRVSSQTDGISQLSLAPQDGCVSDSVIRGNTTAGLKAAKPAVMLTDGSNLNQDVTEATLKRASLF
jgi:hypothetical protein